MNMQGVAKYYEPGEADVKALQAGNDIILFPLDVAKAIKQVQKALKKKKLDLASIDVRVKKILRAKYWAGLNKSQQIKTANLTKRINNDNASLLNRMLYEKAVTLVDNSDNLIPQMELKDVSFASVLMGGKMVLNLEKCWICMRLSVICQLIAYLKNLSRNWHRMI